MRAVGAAAGLAAQAAALTFSARSQSRPHLLPPRISVVGRESLRRSHYLLILDRQNTARTAVASSAPFLPESVRQLMITPALTTPRNIDSIA